MSELKSIALKIYTIETKSPQNMVNTFERHQEQIEAIDYNVTPDDYILFTRLNSDYAIALTQIESHKKAIPYLNKSLTLLTNDPTIDQKDIKSVKFYQQVLFHRGVSNYRLRKYSESEEDFILLTDLFPDNILYEDWLIALKNVKLNRFGTSFAWLGTGLMLASIIIKRNPALDVALIGIGTAFLIASLGCYLIVSERKRKIGKGK